EIMRPPHYHRATGPRNAAARARSRKRPTTGPRASRPGATWIKVLRGRGLGATRDGPRSHKKYLPRRPRATRDRPDEAPEQILFAKPHKDVDFAVIVPRKAGARAFRALWGAQQLEASPGAG